MTPHLEDAAPTTSDEALGARAHPRTPWHKRAQLRVGDHAVQHVESANISLGGLLVTGLPYAVAPGVEGRLSFSSDDDVEAKLGRPVHDVWLHVRVMWHLKGLTGLAFVKPDANETQWVEALVRVAQDG